MNSDVEKYLCTTCGDHFVRTDEAQQEDCTVQQGELVCRACSIHYPVIGGITRFVPPETYADSFGYQWNIHPFLWAIIVLMEFRKWQQDDLGQGNNG
jgi:uncharacterized protein YbaR (Trm112 family)